MKTGWSPQTPKYDLVITEPNPAPSRSPIQTPRPSSSFPEPTSTDDSQFAEFCNRVIKPGEYVIVFMPHYSFNEYYYAFQKQGFDVMVSPFFNQFDPHTVQNRNPVVFPQVAHEIALIGRRITDLNDTFKPDF